MALNALLNERCCLDGRGGLPLLSSLQPLGDWGAEQWRFSSGLSDPARREIDGSQIDIKPVGLLNLILFGAASGL